MIAPWIVLIGRKHDHPKGFIGWDEVLWTVVGVFLVMLIVAFITAWIEERSRKNG